jgi:hypothetical protein
MTVTATVLYDLVQCPRRVALDTFGDRDQVTQSIPSCACYGNAARFSSARQSPGCGFLSLISPRRTT